MPEFERLGKFLKQKRIEKDLTQLELANTLGNVHSQFISNWERGLCAPPSHSLQSLIKLREELVLVMLEDSRSVIEKKVFPKKVRKTK